MARKMKNSGIEWIGEIPEEWDVLRGKNILSILERPVLESDEVVTCFRDGEVTLRANRREEGFTFSIQETGYQGIEPGDLIVHGMDGFAGAIGISDSRGKASPVLNVMDSLHNKRYIMYYLRCAAYCGLFQSLSTGIRIRTCDTNWNKLKSILYLLPNKEKQYEIASFLDARCALIDASIDKTRASIEEYKKLKQAIITEAVTKGVRGKKRRMKDSGIEWIGEIPEEWEVLRGKNILSILERPVLENDEVVTCFRDGEVTLRSNRREEGFTFSIQETGYQGIEPGDLIVHGMDGFAGAIGISDSRGKASPVLNVMDSLHNKRYIMYYLRCAAYCGLFLSLSTGIRIRTCDTNWNKLKNILYLIPNNDEQGEVVAYLDGKIKVLDDIMRIKEQFISEITSYKKSVIFEYVTGKKEVPA